MELSLEQFKPLLNKRVQVTKLSGAVYGGLLCGFNKDGGGKVCLSHLFIYGKTACCPKHQNVRWFWLSKIKTIVEFSG